MNKTTTENVRMLRWTGAALLTVACLPAQAGELAYGIGYTITHSDNVARVPADSNPQSENINSYLLGVSYNELSADLVARVYAQTEFRDYRKNVFNDETLFGLRSYLLWNILPQRFSWTFEDTYDESRINSTLPDTPNNRTRVNSVNTGPDVYFRFNPVNTLALGARVGNVDAGGNTNINSNRYSGTAAWLYQANATTTYSLNLSTNQVNFEDSTTNTDYTNNKAFVRVDYRPSRSQFTLDLGKTRIERDRAPTLDESLVQLTWVRELTTESRFGISASGEYSDTGTDLLSLSTSTTPTVTGGVVTSDIYYTKRGSAFYSYRGSVFSVDLTAFSQNLDFQTTLQDRREYGGRLRVDIKFSPNTTLSLFADQTRSDYKDFVRNDTDTDTAARLSYRLTRAVSLGLEGRRLQRSSTIAANEYDENRILFSIQYASHPSLTLNTFGSVR